MINKQEENVGQTREARIARVEFSMYMYNIYIEYKNVLCCSVEADFIEERLVRIEFAEQVDVELVGAGGVVQQLDAHLVDGDDGEHRLHVGVDEVVDAEAERVEVRVVHDEQALGFGVPDVLVDLDGQVGAEHVPRREAVVRLGAIHAVVELRKALAQRLARPPTIHRHRTEAVGVRRHNHAQIEHVHVVLGVGHRAHVIVALGARRRRCCLVVGLIAEYELSGV